LFLVFGFWFLVFGFWLLVVGCWLLVVGCWLLVVDAEHFLTSEARRNEGISHE
jgi:hypothetical protein